MHWLSVEQQVSFKIAVLAFDCVRGTCSLLSLLQVGCIPLDTLEGFSRLHFAHPGDLHVLATDTTRLDPRSFCVAAPTVWNTLPRQVHVSNLIREKLFRSGPFG